MGALATSGPVSAWIEAAESLDEVIVNPPSPGYAVLQGDVKAQGTSAFRLVNTNFDDQTILIAPSIQPSVQTKLYFQGRLRYATAAQVARVQVSTNNGGSWTNAWSLPGSGDAGEVQSTFQLETIDLGPWAGSTIRVRFILEFTSGSAYVDPAYLATGWYIDDIQIGGTFTPHFYDDVGDPTADEVLIVEFINRARADALAEAQRLRNTTDPQVLAAYNSFNVNLEMMEQQFAQLERSVQPLAINGRMTQASRLHSQDQFNNQFQGHQSSTNPVPPNQPGDLHTNRLERQGYNYSIAGENVYSYARSAWHSHAGFNVDWGFGPGGMQTPAGHRLNLHNPTYTEVGVGAVLGTNGPVGPMVVTQVLGRGASFGGPFLTGVTYTDANGDVFYTPGEGIGGVQVTVAGAAFYTVSSSQGAYAIPLPGDGSYSVTFQRNGYPTVTRDFDVVGGRSVKIDYTPVSGSGNYANVVSATHIPPQTLRLVVDTDMDAANLRIQGSSNLGSWTNVSGTTTHLGGSYYQIDLQVGSGAQFYRIAAAQ